MRSSLSMLSAVAIAVVTHGAVPCSAQCMDWNAGFDAPGTSNDVRALASYDDGSGLALYAAGEFGSAGGSITTRIARWKGYWEPVGSSGGLNGTAHALVVFDDGSGPALYVGGEFTLAGGVTANRVARWNGSSWTAVGSLDGIVYTLAVVDEGSGSALYAGGTFTSGGANRIARWDGATWTPLGTGVNGAVRALAEHDDGSGRALFAGGDFTQAGGSPVNSLAKWDGSMWSPLGSGVGGFSPPSVRALTPFDDGTGTVLFVGGFFTTAGGLPAEYVARWDGANWAGVGNVCCEVFALVPFDDGSGSALHAVGSLFVGGGSEDAVLRWNGSSWTQMNSTMLGSAYAAAAFDDGFGPRLYVGGSFSSLGGVSVNHIAKLEGATWRPLGNGRSGQTRALTVLEEADGRVLCATGYTIAPGYGFSPWVAKWNGSTWSSYPQIHHSPTSGAAVHVLGTFDDGTGPALYAGGAFLGAAGRPNFFARWSGTAWTAVGGGAPSNAVFAIASVNDGTGTALFIGGTFTSVAGVSANRIAKWDGASWSALGGGIGNGLVQAIAAFDDGTGPRVYALGSYSSAGGAPANGLASWDGASWTPVAGASGGTTMVVFDDGSGPGLYVGGSFSIAGGAAGDRVAKWDGRSWFQVGGGIPIGTSVSTLAVFNDGTGPALYAGGSFSTAGAASASNVAKWDGAAWSALGTGTDAEVRALAMYDDGDDGAPDLYAGGLFLHAGGKNSSVIGEWLGCPPGHAFCFGDGIDPVVTAECPCGNVGFPEHGCANSNASLGGARLIASGTTSPNTILFTCTGIPNHNLCTFLRGTLDDAGGSVFGDGVKCASGTLLRFAQQTAGQGGNPANAALASPGSVVAGTTRYYQVHYRNPSAGYCPPELFNVSNGYRLTW